MHHEQSSTCSLCGLALLEEASLLTGASPKPWATKARKAEYFLAACSVCSQSHRTKSRVNRAKSAQNRTLCWVHTSRDISEHVAFTSQLYRPTANHCTDLGKDKRFAHLQVLETPRMRLVRVSSESGCWQKPLLFFFSVLVVQWIKPWPCSNKTKYFYCIIKISCFNTLPCTNEVKQCRVQNCQIYKMIKQVSKASRDHAQRYQKFDLDFNFIF